MLSHSLPFSHQTAEASRVTRESFVAQHRNALFAFSCVFIVISLLVVWQQHAATVAHQSPELPDTTFAPPLSPTTLLPEPNSPVESSSLDSSRQNTTTDLKVNNQSIAVPQNGTVHTVVPSEDGNTSVEFSTESHSVGSGPFRSHSSTSIQIHSDNQAQIDSMSPE